MYVYKPLEFLEIYRRIKRLTTVSLLCTFACTYRKTRDSQHVLHCHRAWHETSQALADV